MPLHHPVAIETFVLDDVPVVVRLAVLLSLGASQKHDAANLSASRPAWESGRSSLQPFLAETEDPTLCKSDTYPSKKSQNPSFRARIRELGLTGAPIQRTSEQRAVCGTIPGPAPQACPGSA